MSLIAPDATFGFESEWARNYSELLVALHREGLIPEPTPHRYHCPCEYCADLNREHYSFPLRAQTDSSCDGEIVSGIYRPSRTAHWDQFVTLTQEIQKHAVAVDAEPGPHAGFHVHARTPHLNIRSDGRMTPEAIDAITAITLTLPSLMTTFARGRHSIVSGWNNRDTWVEVQHGIRNSWQGFDRTAPVANLLTWRTAAHQAHNNPDAPQWPREAYYAITHVDRHALINWRTRYQTIEIRLLRSTRMAWRMQMNCLLSALLVSPKYHAAVLDAVTTDTPIDTLQGPEFLIDILRAADRRDTHAETLANLLTLQADFVRSGAEVPAAFTLA